MWFQVGASLFQQMTLLRSVRDWGMALAINMWLLTEPKTNIWLLTEPKTTSGS
jgi:hypothetical protein